MHILQHRNPRIFANSLSEDALWFQDIEKPLFSLVSTVGSVGTILQPFSSWQKCHCYGRVHPVFEDSDGDDLDYGELVKVLLCLPLWSVVISRTREVRGGTSYPLNS